METECRFRTTQKILQSRAYGSVQTDRVELAHMFMTVRREIAKPRRTDAYLKQHVEELSGESAWRQVYRSSGFEIAAGALMNYVG